MPQNFKLPQIWARDFNKAIYVAGKANNVMIEIFKELDKELGGLYKVAASVIEMARRFNQNGFHASNQEMLDHMNNTISLRKLSRDKAALAKLGVFHCKGGVKNRTHYYLHAEWFETFISRLFNKLGILQRQIGASHIISNDHKIIDDHIFKNNIDFEILQEYENEQRAATKQPTPEKPLTDLQVSKRISNAIADPQIKQQIIWFVMNFKPTQYKSKRHALNTALRLYRLGKWGIPRGLIAEQSFELERLAEADKALWREQLRANPIAKMLRENMRRAI